MRENARILATDPMISFNRQSNLNARWHINEETTLGAALVQLRKLLGTESRILRHEVLLQELRVFLHGFR